MSNENQNTSLETQSTTTESTVSKEQFDKVTSELAKYKKQNRDLLSEDERRKADDKEKDDKIAQLEKLVAKSNLKSSLSIHGEEYSEKISEALSSGNLEETVKLFNKLVDDRVSKVQKEFDDFKLNSVQQPSPNGSTNNGGTMTKEEFKKLSLDEQINIKVNQPEVYKAIFK